MKEQFDKIFSDEPEVKPTPIGKQPTKQEDQFSLFEVGDSEIKITDEGYYKTLANTEHFYQIINGKFPLQLFVKTLLEQTEVCFDTETTGIDANLAELVGIAFSYAKGQAYYIPFPEDQTEAQEYIEILRPFFENEQIVKIGQNIKYDIKVLKKYKVAVNGFLFDTMIAHYLINPDMRHNMDILAETYLQYQPKPIEDLIGKKGKGQKTMREVAFEEVKEYAGEDADITYQLKEVFAPKLEQTKTLELFDDIESPLVSVLAAMEAEGIRLDVAYLKELSKELLTEANALQAKIFEAAGEEFNLASPKQLGIVLFEKIKIGSGKIKKTKTGQYATGEEVLSDLAKDNEIVRDILEWRQIVKLQNTYVDALPLQINPNTGRVHTDYMQAVAATGRLSSNNPNLQNIPIRTERGQKVRRAFIARDENHVLVSADYSQIELRIIAALSQEPNMMESFKNKEDIHRSTAAKVFNVALDEVTREQRSNAKTVNFGIIYGVSAFGLSNQTNLTRAESKELIDTYYATYPKLKAYIQEQIDFARDYGYVQTVSGRRRYLKDIHSQNAMVRSGAERNAVNAPIQGSAADIIKIAMINIHQRLQKEQLQTKMLLQVHDELVFDVPKTELELIKPIIKEEMEHAFQLAVPLEVEIGEGPNWLDAH
ncbi:MAG TPA: DNA polymerase I, partial [Flavobacterium sp.]|nr:DNA polymerase I [Flavobacterium sp.]